MARVTEKIIMLVPVTITYDKRKGLRDEVVSHVKSSLGVNCFGSGTTGSYSAKTAGAVVEQRSALPPERT